MNNPSELRCSAHPEVLVNWTRGMQFNAGVPGGPTVRIDGDRQDGPGPFDVLLAAIATCASTDVLSILSKQRTPAQSLSVRVQSDRVNGTPRPLARAVLHFAVRGPGIAPDKAERAVDLAITKYCSVRASLLADAAATWTVKVETLADG